MATFTTLPVREARESVLPPRRAVQERYRGYVRSLNPEWAGRLELDQNDRPITERARLKAAAKAEGLNLHIQRRANTIVFWSTPEPPEPRRGGGRGRKKS
jgi:hypothetical protein